jgi:intracellular sulfur oxidation DsrE/DsrF family protein
MSGYSVVVHVNDRERIPIAAGSITNLVKDLAPDRPRVELVINGTAVAAFQDQKVLQQLQDLQAQGVDVVACRNSLLMVCGDNPDCPVAEDRLPSFIRVVSAGITEILRRQSQGYAYIKP